VFLIDYQLETDEFADGGWRMADVRFAYCQFADVGSAHAFS
jgi:hypothetical protein